MKAPLKTNRLKAIMSFFLLSVFAVSCSKSGTTPDPVYVKPAVAIKAAENVTMTTATIVAKVVPNESATTVTLEYMETGTSWGTALTQTASGKDSVTITSGLLNLKKGTVYSFRVRASNKGGEAISSESSFETYAVADFDGNLYHTVVIGTQTWLKENFRGTHYANGDAIPNVNDAATWQNLTTGAYCWYNKDPELGKVYGGLYNWYVGADSRGLISGWKVPTVDEWAVLYNFLGGYAPAGPKVMETGSAHWKNTLLPATNTSGFTALPNGDFGVSKITNNFEFMDLGASAVFWASSVFGADGDAVYIDASRCGLNVGALFPKNRGLGLRPKK